MNATETDEPLLLTPKEAAKLLGVSMSTLIRLDRSGELKAIQRVKRRPRYSSEQLRQWVRAKAAN